MAAPEVMTKKQACQYLHISLATLERWMAAERLSVVKLGRRVLDKKRAEVSLEELTAEMAGGQELAELSHELKR